MLMPKHIRKRDGKIDLFEPLKIKEAVFSAVREIYKEDTDEITEKITELIKKNIGDHFNGNIPSIEDIQRITIESMRQLNYNNIATIYENYSKERADARKLLSIAIKDNERSTTDAALLIESDTKDTLASWDRTKIIEQLKEEANLSQRYAEKIAKKVENMIVGIFKKGGIKRFHTTDIRMFVDMILKEERLENQQKKQALLGLPSADFLKIVFSKSSENSNIAANNPEAVNLEVAERIQKPWALANIFSQEVANAHFNGEIHLHDLGYPTRVYCSSHSLEFIKKYGLGKILENLESKSNPPNSAAVLNQHVQTFLASMQAHYAGALGFGFLNILYAPLLNRPVKLVYGKINGLGTIKKFEKTDFEKLIEQNIFSTDESANNYFKVEGETIELREVGQKEFDQVAQNLIFASSQNAFSRGGQTLFIDFNIHTGIPSYLKQVPAIGPGGKYMVKKRNGTIEKIDEVPRIKTENKDDPKNGDADNSQLKGDLEGGEIITYGQLESTAQRFCKSLLEVWRKGDKDGRPFHFPKCDLHVEESSFTDPKQKELIDLATEITAENGSVYFMFDRGNGAVLAQCCRLKEKVEDTSMLKYPERLRFTGFQNVTINIAQASYIGKNLTGTLKQIEKVMETALKAHQQKAKFMKRLLETDGSPMRNLGRISDDGFQYIDLKKSTYIIGNIGLNEAVQFLTGKQLHESPESYETGLAIIAFMYKKINEFKKRTGLKFTIEETPGESTTRRLAILDKTKFKQAIGIVKGTDKDPYYTNSIHFAPDAKIGITDRIVGQSKFHDMIESGAIIHAYIGEQRPNKEALQLLVKKTLQNTRCSQLVFSPTYTECNCCGKIMPGEKHLCTNYNCSNSKEETLEKRTMNIVTRIVGYYSGTSKWNGSQKEIFNDRKSAETNYAGEIGKDMSWLYNPKELEKLTIILFSKNDCPNCKKTKQEIEQLLKELQIENEIDFRVYHLDEAENEGLVNTAKYNIPLDSVPSVVVIGKEGFWKKTTEYGSDENNCQDGVCNIGPTFGKSNMISPEEIRIAIKEKREEFLNTR